MAPRTISTLFALILGSVGLIACGGSGKKYYVPVDAPDFKPFVPVEVDEEDSDDWDDDDDDDDNDGGDGDGGDGDGDGDGGAKPAPGGAVKVDIGDANVTGSRAKNDVQASIRQKLAAVRMCYERELARNPKLAGTVRVAFTILGDGSVTKVAASGLAVVDACVGKTIGSINFGKLKSGQSVRVTYPFIFKTN